MSVDKTSGAGNAGANAPSCGENVKRGVKSEETQQFEDLMKKVQSDKEAGKDVAKEDMQKLLGYSIKQSTIALGRRLQETAKDIERENIDKGF